MSMRHVLWQEKCGPALGYDNLRFCWHPDSTHIAVAGSKSTVQVFDRHGEVVDEIVLIGSCVGMDWDKEGDTLAIIETDSGIARLWSLHSHKVTEIDTNLRDLSHVVWSKTGPQLSIGSAKGVLLIYNKKTFKKIPIVGKHMKRITCGAWSDKNFLALGGEDKQVTLSNPEGDTIGQTLIQYDPHQIQFSMMKTDDSQVKGDNTISLVMGKKNLLLLDMSDLSRPIQLQFLPQYGNIVSYQWYGDGYMLLGFSSGFLVVISTHMDEIGQELFSHQFHTAGITSVAASSVVKKAATCGQNTVKIIDLSDWKEVKSETLVLDEEDGEVNKLEWSPDGQILTAVTSNGALYTFLTKLPALATCNGNLLAYLTSLRELSIVNGAVLIEQAAAASMAAVRVGVSVEPSIISLGPEHVAVAMNDQAWFYSLRSRDTGLVCDRTYSGSVEKIVMSAEYAAVLHEKHLILHRIGGSDNDQGEDSIMLPSVKESGPGSDKSGNVTLVEMAGDFVVYVTEDGTIRHFMISQWAQVNEYTHDTPIRHIASNAVATRVVIIDESENGFVYNPVDDSRTPIPNLPRTVTNVMWQSGENTLFVVCDPSSFYVYVYACNSIEGSVVNLTGAASERVANSQPLSVINGRIISQLDNGGLGAVVLDPFNTLVGVGSIGSGIELLTRRFHALIELNKYEDAWQVARTIYDRSHTAKRGGGTVNESEKAASEELMLELIEFAMKGLEVDVAMRAARLMSDAGLSLALESVSKYDDRRILGGHIATLLGDYTKAQELFLSSSTPLAALEMRMDVFHWEQALSLARSLAPEQIPRISRAYAEQLEFKGESSHALEMYEAGDESGDLSDPVCRGGVARCLIRLGNVQRGISLVNTATLALDCAKILENLKQYYEAAQMYEKGKNLEMAATYYIQTKNFSSAQPLMRKITAPRIHLAYARACEAAGKYSDAEKAYEAAKEINEVVRLNLSEHLNRPQKAFKLVRKTRTEAGAVMVAKFCQQSGDVATAVEFLLMAKRNDEALNLADAHGQMEAFAEALGENGTQEEYSKIAAWFEKKGNYRLAGEYKLKCGDFDQAVHLLLKCGDEVLERVIEIVGQSKADHLVHLLIEHLLGNDGQGPPKDPKYVFMLYMSLKKYTDAANAAVFMAHHEVELGNVKSARDLLFDTYIQLRAAGGRIPHDMWNFLTLLHSYVLVKIRVKMGDHHGAARLLKRVAGSINLFSIQLVPILTLAVIECQRAGLKTSAFEFAGTLMRKENRARVDPKFKSKIEKLVRKPEKVADPPESSSPCPVCGSGLADTELECQNCRNVVPFCLSTGRHCVLNDFTQCPHCQVPSIRSAFLATSAAAGNVCPMCGKPIEDDGPHMTVEEARASIQEMLAQDTVEDEEEEESEDDEEYEEESEEDEN